MPMREWDGVCQRCFKPSISHIMSMFNEELICAECKAKERRDPRYRQAVEADEAAMRRGDFNFSGIGRRP